MGRTRSAAARRPATASPNHNRRVSGPIRPGHPRPVTAVPPRIHVPQPTAAPRRASITGVLRALPDHRWLDSLLRSRAWIWIIGIGLGGIVAMQVSLLKMNAGIGESVAAGAALQHSNAKLEERVAELSSGSRIGAAATDLGLVSPDAGSVGFLTVRPRMDPLRAAQNMTPPSAAARALLQSGGLAPGAVAPVSTATTPAAATTTTTTTTSVAPATSAAVAPAATPAAVVQQPVATPAPTVAPPVAPVTQTGQPVVDQTAGAVAAPSG